jgi:glycerophosphoryl diester phosphodiesterase
VGLDIYFGALNQETLDAVHACGLEVNVWTVDEAAVAKRLIKMGVDYITSDILE